MKIELFFFCQGVVGLSGDIVLRGHEFESCWIPNVFIFKTKRVKYVALLVEENSRSVESFIS